MKKAILLLNMGGANSPDEVEVFLKNMFSDIHILPIKFNPIRRLVATAITRWRAGEAKSNLSHVGGRSPLIGNTKKLLKKLNRKIRAEAVMRYTPPFAKDVLEKLRRDNIEQLILFPLYPQYSTTTTLSSFEDIFNTITEMNWGDVAIKTVPPYYRDRQFLQILAKSIKKGVPNPKEFHLIFSAHSLPQKVIDKGDPYLDQIHTQIELLSKLLPQFKSINLAFQSKLGPVKWLEPSLDKTLEKFRGEKVAIYPISFVVDNIETDFELNIQYREVAKRLGLLEYLVIPSLNDSEEFIQFIFSKIKE
ncbi:MAG TPA: ferrochelatase [Campylobacterales bacterium]|nr:ferrochelatase [Campylobacterales bacterium]